MDIQISSNFERLLFEAYGRDAGAVRRPHGEPRAVALLHDRRRAARAHPRRSSRRTAVDEASVAAEMAETYRATGYVLDPHSAVGTRAGARASRGAARRYPVDRPRRPPTRRSFPDAVERATGLRPALPPHMADLMERTRASRFLPNDQAAVERFIRDARAGGIKALAA